MQKRYEGRFKESFTKNEKRLQTLSHHKERILNDLKGMFKKDLKLSLDKDNDPFYQNVQLSPTLRESDNKDGYVLKVAVPKHDADKVRLTGSGRQLKLAMDRDYKFTKNADDATVDAIVDDTAVLKN